MREEQRKGSWRRKRVWLEGKQEQGGGSQAEEVKNKDYGGNKRTRMGTRNKDEEREEDDFIKVLLTGQPRPVLSYWVGPAGSRPPAIIRIMIMTMPSTKVMVMKQVTLASPNYTRGSWQGSARDWNHDIYL